MERKIACVSASGQREPFKVQLVRASRAVARAVTSCWRRGRRYRIREIHKDERCNEIFHYACFVVLVNPLEFLCACVGPKIRLGWSEVAAVTRVNNWDRACSGPRHLVCVALCCAPMGGTSSRMVIMEDIVGATSKVALVLSATVVSSQDRLQVG